MTELKEKISQPFVFLKIEFVEPVKMEVEDESEN